MAITFNDNINVSAQLPLDRKYGTFDGTSISNAISVANGKIDPLERYKGLTVGLTVNSGDVVEYWYKSGTGPNDLVLKSGTVSGAGNGLSNTNGTIGLGGTLSQATSITTTGSNTLTIAGLQDVTGPTHYVSADSNGKLTLSTVSSLQTSIQNNILNSISASNGVNKTSGNVIKLGGALTENTTLSTINDRLILAGVNNSTGVASSDVLLLTSTGVVQKTPYNTLQSTLTTSVTNNIVAENGLSKPSGFPGTIRLGGTLLPGSSTTINLGPQFDPNNPSQPGADSNLFIANKWINRPFHSESAFTRTNINFDTFDYVQFLSGDGWVLTEPTTPTPTVRWEGTVSTGYQRVTGNTTTWPLTNNTIPSASTTYYITVYIRPRSTAATGIVTGSVSISFGGSTSLSFTSINKTTKGELTTVSSPTTGLIVTPTSNFDGNIRILIARKSIADNASRTRIISFRGGAAMWTTNFAYINTTTPFQYYLENAFEDYLYSKPWLYQIYPKDSQGRDTFPVGASFQITENLHATTKSSSISSHYNDERATFASLTWWNTFTSPTVANLYGRFFSEYKETAPGSNNGGWVAGQVYTLKEKKTGDVFQTGMGTTISGSPDNSGWVFVSNGTLPTTWTNGSVIEGDFPIIEKSPKYSAVIASEGQDPGDTFNYQKGIVNIVANTTFVTGLLDQGSSTRGFKLALIPTLSDLLAIPSPPTGEMVYLSSANSIVVKTSLGGSDNGWREVMLKTIDLP